MGETVDFRRRNVSPLCLEAEAVDLQFEGVWVVPVDGKRPREAQGGSGAQLQEGRGQGGVRLGRYRVARGQKGEGKGGRTRAG